MSGKRGFIGGQANWAGAAFELRAIVATAPAWVSEEMLSASGRIGDDRVVLRMSEC